jgi:hypothetical protein
MTSRDGDKEPVGTVAAVAWAVATALAVLIAFVLPLRWLHGDARTLYVLTVAAVAINLLVWYSRRRRK